MSGLLLLLGIEICVKTCVSSVNFLCVRLQLLLKRIHLPICPSTKEATLDLPIKCTPLNKHAYYGLLGCWVRWGIRVY